MLSDFVLDPGYLAGLAVSLLWTFTTLFFTAASRRIGPAMVNAARLMVALVLHTIAHRALTGRWLPEARPQQVYYLCASGLIGLTIGDLCIFQAFLTLGPRRTLLIQTIAPILAALFGWVALGETLSVQVWIGIGLTLAGIAWVIRERAGLKAALDRNHRTRGYALAVAAAVCQSAGLLLSKQGMGHGWLAAGQHMQPQTATLLRMTFATLGMIPILLVRVLRERPLETKFDAAHDHRQWMSGVLFAAGGAVTGPFFGVWLSLIAANRVSLGIAQTLLSLAPIMILPFAKWFYKEHLSMRTIAGTALALIGVAVLCLD